MAMKESLKNWADQGLIREQEFSASDISRLLHAADRDIFAAQSPGLPLDWKFNIAYNAILNLASAVLAAEGYRIHERAHHYLTLQSLKLTLGVDENLLDLLDAYRKKRNLTTYREAGIIVQSESDQILSIACTLSVQINQWFKDHHPDFLNK
jgi:hypothetical protein